MRKNEMVAKIILGPRFKTVSFGHKIAKASGGGVSLEDSVFTYDKDTGIRQCVAALRAQVPMKRPCDRCEGEFTGLGTRCDNCIVWVAQCGPVEEAPHE